MRPHVRTHPNATIYDNLSYRGLGINREGLVAPQAELPNSKLPGASFGKVNLEGANLSGSDLASTNLAGSNLDRADLSGSQLPGASLKGVSARSSNFSRANLNGADLTEISLGAARLAGATLRGTKLQGAVLEESDLTGADLSDAQLSGANLRKARLVGARLRGAMLQGADLSGADLSSADLEGINLEGAEYDRATRWPIGVDPSSLGALPKPTRSTVTNHQITLTSVGPVHLGMTVAQACNALPEMTLERGEDVQGISVINVSRGTTEVFRFYTWGSAAGPIPDDQSKISAICVYDKQYRTNSGIYPTMLLTSAEKVYGKLLRIQRLEFAEREEVTFQRSPKGILIHVSGYLIGKYARGPAEGATTRRYDPSARISEIMVVSPRVNAPTPADLAKP